MAESMDAIFLDAGGVLLLPDADLIAGRLREAGVTFDPDRAARAHYVAVRAIDLAEGSIDVWEEYVSAYLVALDVPEAQHSVAARALRPIWELPALAVWHDVPPGTREALRDLAAAGYRLVIVSNSDGSVAEQLGRLGVCQVGPGDGVEVAAVLDSSVVGVAKPDPGIFRLALEAARIAPERAVHVGDGLHNDVAGAAAAGITPLHFDPYGLCEATDHGHLAQLRELLPR